MRQVQAAVFFTALMASLAVWGQSPPVPIRIVVPPDARIAWRGISVDEAAGAQGLAMLYPAPSAGGFLAAIFTHALIVQGARSSQVTANQAAADKVLEPHAGPITRMTLPWVVEQALVSPTLAKRIQEASPGAASSEGTWIQISPRFAMAPDRRVLVLDNAIKIFRFGGEDKPYFENIVRVVSSPRLEAEPLKTWTDEEGKALQATAVELVAHSLDVAMTIAFASNAPFPARTQRYRFGLEERMERGHPVAFACGRVVLRTLREWLMSVPIGLPNGETVCAEPYRLEVASPQP